MNKILDQNTDHMPPLAPLNVEQQDFKKSFCDTEAPGADQISGTWIFRAWIFGLAAALTLALIAILLDWFQADGFGVAEIVLMGLVSFSTFWIALAVASAVLGVFFPRVLERSSVQQLKTTLKTALLVPVYEEDPLITFKRIAAMRRSLERRSSRHHFALFILSDTKSDETALREVEQFNKLRVDNDSKIKIYYRRRAKNTGRKAGNIQNWIANWGADWDTFITLDADSLMSARTIHDVTDALSDMPETGLIQTIPRLIGASTMFARIQQFSNNIYGGVLAKGLDRWVGIDGNYWGHNAIIRTRAFARSAGLPELSGSGPLSGNIKSHDFVEAALLRRAGWAVRVFTELDESYEEIPPTLIDYILRDRRWCQGNLQHLRLISARGLSSLSRFHLFQGAMAYLSSVVWFVLLIVWTIMGRSEEQNIVRYFTDANPLFPQWPHMDTVSRIAVLAGMLALLLVPKLLGVFTIYKSDTSCHAYGGKLRFLMSSFCEILLSFVLAPILMVQHVLSVGRTVFGHDAGWSPQNRSGSNYGFIALVRFHWLETCIGLLLAIGFGFEIVSLWLLPIAFSLLFAVPISFITGVSLPKTGLLSRVMTTRENWTPPRIVTMVHQSGHDLGVIEPSIERKV